MFVLSEHLRSYIFAARCRSNYRCNIDSITAAPASCEVRAVIRLLQTEGQSTAQIRRGLCRVYGYKFVSYSCVRESCRKFRDGSTDLHDEGCQE
jgi:hypothetical protein